MLAVTCDNASNMDTMFTYIATSCKEEEVDFDSNNQRVRCLAHIINLAAQSTLKHLKVHTLEEEEEIIDETNEHEEDIESIGIIKKVYILYFIIYFTLHYEI